MGDVTSPPATVQNLLANGVVWLEADCLNCNHRGRLKLADFPPAASFVEIRKRLVCSRCRSRKVSAMPDWRDAPASGRHERK